METQETNKIVNKRKDHPVKEARKILSKKHGGRNVTQDELGKKLHISGSMVSMIEKGRRELSMDNAERLSEMTGLRVPYLLGIDGYPTEEDMYKAFSGRLDFYKTWRVSFVDLIADQFDYKMDQEQIDGIEYFTFTDSNDRTIKVPKKEIADFLDEYYEYAKFRIEKLIDSHRHELYKKEEQGGI